MTFWIFVAACLSVQVGSRAAEGTHIGTGEIVALGVVFVGWLRAVGGGKANRDHWVSRGWNANRWLVLFAAWVSVASVANLVLWGRGASFRSLREIVPGMTLYFTMTVGGSTVKVRRLFNYGVLVVVLAAATTAMLQYIWGVAYINPVNPDAWFKHQVDGYSLVRHPVVGLMGHPNGLGLVLVPCLSIVSGSLAGRLRRGLLDAESILSCAAILAGVLALWLSQAKMAMFVGAIAISVAFLGTWWGGRFSAKWGMATLALICAIGALGVWVATTALSAAGGLELGTLWYRVFLAKESLAAISHSMTTTLIGGGLDIYRRAHPIELTAHNEILNLMLKYGAVGTLLFAIAYVHAIRAAQSPDWSAGIALVSLAAVLLVESANGVQALSLVYGLLAYASVSSGKEAGGDGTLATSEAALGSG